MKPKLLPFTSAIILMMTISTGLAQIPMLPQTVSMDPGYTNEVYYQFNTQNATEVARNTWDISFRTMIMSSSILTNDGSGVTLWTYPYADTSGWASIDTTGLSTWNPMYNDPTDWENGAFSRHATEHPDYGWGKYNMATHVIVGDSLFIIKLNDGVFKKLWIIEKNSPLNLYTFRYANLDGSDMQEISVDCNLYTETEFIGFNMQTNQVVDYQPAKDSWDILFTKYMSVQPNGEPYPVSGVLSNPATYTKRYYPVDPDFNNWEIAPWDSTRSNIGWDWKMFDMGAMEYKVNDSMVFYVKDLQSEVYRLKFTAFAGSSTGNIDFGIALVSPSAIGDRKHSDFQISLYPNPATDIVTIEIETLKPVNEVMSLSLLDISGRTIRTDMIPAGQKKINWNIYSLSPGVYLIKVTSGNKFSLNKFIKR
jgi:predicted lipoprotein with Yx(FWY)xxD motif